MRDVKPGLKVVDEDFDLGIDEDIDIHLGNYFSQEDTINGE